MATKPVKWTFNSGSVDPVWSWFWSGQTWCLPMWEGTGTAVANIGTITNTSMTMQDTSWGNDVNGTTIDFNGSSGYLNMVSPIGFGTLVSRSAYTLYAVVRPTGAGVDRSILMDYDGGSTLGLVFRHGTDNKWSVAQNYQAAMPYVYSTTLAANNTLATIVHTWDGANQKIYVNGALEGTLARTGIDAGFQILVGRWVGGTSPFSGSMSLIGVQRTAWTAQHVADFAANPFGPITQVQSGPSRSTIRFSSATSGTPNALRPASPTSQGGTLPPSYIKFK